MENQLVLLQLSNVASFVKAVFVESCLCLLLVAQVAKETKISLNPSSKIYSNWTIIDLPEKSVGTFNEQLAMGSLGELDLHTGSNLAHRPLIKARAVSTRLSECSKIIVTNL